MTDDSLQGGRERLGSLRAGLNRSLERFARNRLVAASLPVAPRSQERRRTASSDGAAQPWGAGLRSGPPLADGHSLTESPAGAVIDDERQVRAMAKQIKRLIIEDRRRGLGIGG